MKWPLTNSLHVEPEAGSSLTLSFNLCFKIFPYVCLRLEEAQTGIKIAGRNMNNVKYADNTTLMAESEEELKSLLMKVKEESEKVGLKLNIQTMKRLTLNRTSMMTMISFHRLQMMLTWISLLKTEI